MNFWMPNNARGLQPQEYSYVFEIQTLTLQETNYLARKIHIFISRYNTKKAKARGSPREANRSFRAVGAAQPDSEMSPAAELEAILYLVAG